MNLMSDFLSFHIINLSEAEKEQVYAKCEELLKPILFQQGQWIADYCRLRFIAYK